MARQNKITDSGLSQTEIMAEWNAGGERRQALVEKLGFASVNGLYNALRGIGYIPGGPVYGSGNNGEKRTGSVKILGVMPYKVQKKIERLLDLDEDADQPGWAEWKQCAEADPDFEGFTMSRFAGGEESDGGKSYRQWIDSNRAADKSAAEKAARESDPTFQLQKKIASLVGTIAERDAEIAQLQEKLSAAEKRVSSGRGPRMGGELNNDMLRIMKQRFHPDKNNGSPELCEAVMKWLNAIVL